MRKPTADQMARLLDDLELGMRASLQEGHPCRHEAPWSHYDQWRAKGKAAGFRLARSGLREEAEETIRAKLRAEAAERSARRVADCERAVNDARARLDEAVRALDAAREDARRYAEEASKNSSP